MSSRVSALLLLCAALVVPEALGQPAERRPIPYPVTPPPDFQEAIEQDTRTPTGQPGAKYWTNQVHYDLSATLRPETNELQGEGTVRYHNNSPDTLRRAYVHLRQNIYKQGVVRNRPVEITGGVSLSEVAYEGEALSEVSRRSGEPGYTIRGTVMRINLPAPIPPGGSASFSFGWRFQVPGPDNFRMGRTGNVYYLGYWYPQMAAYDDVEGWVAEPYQGDGEFYMDYGSYEVDVTAPEGWLVAATGTLQNPSEVLSRQTRRRFARAAEADSVVHVVRADERGAGTATAESADGTLTWQFRAENVRDVAFGASSEYVWDATRAETGDDADGTTLIHALYRPDQQPWTQAAQFTRFSIEFLSDYLAPYPYPHMTAVEGTGILGGGMEYPMITVIGGSGSPRSLFGTTFHETSHMWIPMIVGTNEKRFAWIDEGLISFNTNEGVAAYYENLNPWEPGQSYYYRLAGTDEEAPPMRHADQYPYGTPARVIASYSKPALVFHALRGVIGKKTFERAYRTFIERWAYKHPYPYDLFNTFEDVAERDLDWFWTSLFYETWTLDQALADVRDTEEAIVVTVEDRGQTPMPTPVRLTYEDGRTVTRTVPVETWLEGERTATLRFDPGEVERLEIDPQGYFPDTDRSDNVLTP